MGNLIENNVDSNYKIYISHAEDLELAIEGKEIISNAIKDADIEIKELGPVFITQGGPSCISIQVIKKHEELK